MADKLTPEIICTSFIKELSNIPFKKEEYQKIGLSDQFINDNLKSYHCIKREKPLKPLTDEYDPIIYLIAEYEVANFSIGMISFNNEIIEKPDFIVFGKFELDRLAISNITKEVVMLDGVADTIQLYCAVNSENFLKAIIHIGSFLEKRVFDDNLFDDEDANIEVARQSSELAGGNKYFDFYKMMLGF